ncbi:MAG: hypothetical protein WDO71_29105 [Bacteroidota bacterium]
MLQYTGIGNDGLSAYLDADKNGTISNDKDRVASGTALPNRLYSFYGNVDFKGFDLAINFNGVSGIKFMIIPPILFFIKLNWQRALILPVKQA